MKLWKDMTSEEKGALLLAYHEGKVIEWGYGYGKDFHVAGSSAEEGLYPEWTDYCSYRVKPEPKQPREFWLWCNGRGEVIQKYNFPIERHQMHFLAGDELIRVREVLE